jgi:hypothetical protein
VTPVALAAAQLVAYNARDIDAFCACFAEDVQVFDAHGAVTLDGIAAFRAAYADAFGAWEVFGAEVDRRDADGHVVVDHERWWRSRGDERREGRVQVTYTVRGGRIANVRFTPEAT